MQQLSQLYLEPDTRPQCVGSAFTAKGGGAGGGFASNKLTLADTGRETDTHAHKHIRARAHTYTHVACVLGAVYMCCWLANLLLATRLLGNGSSNFVSSPHPQHSRRHGLAFFFPLKARQNRTATSPLVVVRPACLPACLSVTCCHFGMQAPRVLRLPCACPRSSRRAGTCTRTCQRFHRKGRTFTRLCSC